LKNAAWLHDEMALFGVVAQHHSGYFDREAGEV
jgi:hypothetical protein